MDVPKEIAKDIKDLHDHINELKLVCSEVLEKYENLKKHAEDTPLDSASLDLTIALAINSAFWCK